MPFLLLLADQSVSPVIAVETAPIVVTGSRVAAKPDDLGANVTVLERSYFDVEKPARIADALDRVAGIHIDQVGGRGGTSSLYLRGADPNYTLVLVDGVRVNDPTNARGGSFDFSTMDVADVERIEIARGPYSAIYGGDALAGVINIITRRAPLERVQASLDAMAGAFDTREIALNAAGPAALGDSSGTWSLGLSDSNEGQRIRGNEFESQRLSAGYHTNAGERTRLDLTARYSESERAGFPDDSGGHEFAAIRDPETREARETVLGAGVEHQTGAASYALTLGYFNRDDDIASPGVAPGVRDPFGIPPSVVESSIERLTATFTGTQRFSDSFSLAYGAEFQREEGTSEGELDFGFPVPTSFEFTRTSWAPYAEARVSTEFGLSAQAGVRVDKPEGMGSVTSPRLRVAYDIGDNGLRLAGSWGKAFKLPSLYALGHPLVGNPDLVPERGESHELELSQSLAGGKIQWSATWFDGEFRNAIDFDSGPPPMLVNRNRVDTRGIELAGRYAVNEAWAIDGSVTNARSRIAATGGELRNRPDWRGGVGVHWAPSSALRFSASATHVGSSFDSSIATGDVDLDAYTVLDVSAVWQMSDRFETYLAVDNLTGEKYEQFVGFESRGILPRLGVKFSL
jgi:vitamin B12 transporter